MLVRFLVGKRAGETQHFPRNDNTVAMMIQSGMVEEVLPGSAPRYPGLRGDSADVQPPMVEGTKWGVKCPPFSDVPHLVRQRCSETTYFSNPNDISPYTKKPYGWPSDCPEQARELFEKTYENYLLKRRSAASLQEVTAGNKH